MHSRGGTCPRCKGYTGLSIRGDDPKQFQHRTPEPFRNRCPAGGITRSEAAAGWTSLSLLTYRWLLVNKPDRAEAYRAEQINEAAAASPLPERRRAPCSSVTLRLLPHQPHDWEPQPGMGPVHCPGYLAA